MDVMINQSYRHVINTSDCSLTIMGVTCLDNGEYIMYGDNITTFHYVSCVTENHFSIAVYVFFGLSCALVFLYIARYFYVCFVIEY